MSRKRQKKRRGQKPHTPESSSQSSNAFFSAESASHVSSTSSVVELPKGPLNDGGHVGHIAHIAHPANIDIIDISNNPTHTTHTTATNQSGLTPLEPLLLLNESTDSSSQSNRLISIVKPPGNLQRIRSGGLLGPSPIGPIMATIITLIISIGSSLYLSIPYYWYIALATASLTLLWYLVISDPGILRPSEDGTVAPASDIACDINGMSLRMRWCVECGLFRPPRASHCRRCCVCVDRFDHHCVLISNCVGRGNIAAFITYLLIAAITTLIPVLYQWLVDGFYSIPTILLAGTNGVVALVAGVKYIDTAYGIARNITHREREKGFPALSDYENEENPFDKGIWSNVCLALTNADENPSLVLIEETSPVV